MTDGNLIYTTSLSRDTLCQRTLHTSQTKLYYNDHSFFVTCVVGYIRWKGSG